MAKCKLVSMIIKKVGENCLPLQSKKYTKNVITWKVSSSCWVGYSRIQLRRMVIDELSMPKILPDIQNLLNLHEKFHNVGFLNYLWDGFSWKQRKGRQVIHRNNTAMVRHCQGCSAKDQVSHKEHSASANI